MTVRSAALPVLKGVVAKLNAATIANTPVIRSGAWETTVFPSLLVDTGDTEAELAFDGNGEHVTVACHCWSQDADTEVYQIMDGVKVALDEQTLTLDYGEFSHCRYQDSVGALRDPDGITFHGVISFQVRVDQLQA